MAASFSNSGEDAIQRSIACEKLQQMVLEADDIAVVFEINETAEWIKENGFQRVALQFPDELMVYSVDVIQSLSKKTSAVLAILADTSYGSCCVDEVAAEHFQVEAIVHYGRACLSPVRRLPVFFVFGRQPIDVTDCIAQLKMSLQDESQHILLLYDVVYHNSMKTIVSELTQVFPNLQVPVLDLPTVPTNEEQSIDSTLIRDGSEVEKNERFVRFGRRFHFSEGANINDYTMIFVGPESLFLNACMLTFNKCKFVSYDPGTKTSKVNAWNLNRQLMKRYYLIERARDAERVGILVGTLGVKDYLAVIDRLSSMIRAAGKKCYKFVVGKLNVAKLANFAEIDVYVLVACPENSLVDSSEMYQPVVTPFEMEMACDNTRQWTGDYEVDFQQLLPGGLSYHERTLELKPQMDMSLVTGKIRQLGLDEEETCSHNQSDVQALVRPNSQIAVRGSAGDFLSNRSWQGLDPQLGKTPVIKAIQGTKGTATSYENESIS